MIIGLGIAITAIMMDEEIRQLMDSILEQVQIGQTELKMMANSLALIVKDGIGLIARNPKLIRGRMGSFAQVWAQVMRCVQNKHQQLPHVIYQHVELHSDSYKGHKPLYMAYMGVLKFLRGTLGRWGRPDP